MGSLSYGMKRGGLGFLIVFLLPALSFAGNKKIMTIRAAKILAERAIVESVFGLKLRSTEEVVDMVAARFEGKTESKTSAKIKGITFEEVVYDSVKDIAQATALITLEEITTIDGVKINLKNKTFRRVAFATSTPSQAVRLKALRVAETDAYMKLIQRVVGFTLESKTTVNNYILTSDKVKTKTLATIYMAEVTEYGWDKRGDAFVKMILPVAEISEMIGERIVGVKDEVIEVRGQGAAEGDFGVAK